MITIFTPTYNRAYSLSRLYNSLKKQTFQNFEWLIIDDGSTDGSYEVLKTLEKKYDFIRVFTQDNQGAGPALNRCIGDFYYYDINCYWK